MKTRTQATIGGIIGVIILASLFFVPINDLGIDSHNSEMPPKIMVLSNQPDDFEIKPISCTIESDTVEFQFSVENKLDEDYRLEMHLGLDNKNDKQLSIEAILVEIPARETIFEKHQVLFNSDMSTCRITLERSEKIS